MASAPSTMRARAIQSRTDRIIKIEVEDASARELRAISADAVLDLAEQGLSLSYVDPATRLLLELEGELGVLNTSELGSPGLDYRSQVNQLRETNPRYKPYYARGLGVDFGLYQEVFQSEIQVLRPWTDLVNGLRGGEWWVEAPHPKAEPRARILERALFDLQGGWGAFLINASTAFYNGFAIFEEVFDPHRGRLKKLAFRFSKQVAAWVLDSHQRDLVAVEMLDDFARRYLLPSWASLLINVNAVGNDYEGISPLRPIVKLHLIKDLFTRLIGLAGEKYGIGIFVISQEDYQAPTADSDEAKLFSKIYQQLAAEDTALIELPDGKRFEVVSPDGMMPDFEPIIRYLDEQMSLALQGEGNLLGMKGGSRALAEVADARMIRSVPAYAKIICDAINGSSDTPYQGTLRKLERLIFGAPEDGAWCELRFSLDRAGRDDEWFNRLKSAKEAKMIRWTLKDELELRRELGLSLDTADDAEEGLDA